MDRELAERVATVWFKAETQDGEGKWYQALENGKPNRHSSIVSARQFIINSGLGSLAPCRVVRVTEEVV